MKNIVLVGFMGTGKTTIGKILAEKLRMTLIDTDNLIEKKYNMSVSDIFEKKGELFFRIAETNLLRELKGKNDIILSTGGGIVMKEENLSLLKEIGFVIALTASPEEIYKRTKNRGIRPLLDKVNDEARLNNIRELLDIRKEKYAQADYLLETRERPQKIAKRIIEMMEKEV